MPTFSNAPPPADKGTALPIRRTPPGPPTVGIITSNDLIGTNTHFYGGRTVPCESPQCKPCSEGHPYRWHSYIAAVDPKSHEQYILELTAAATHPIVAYRNAHHTLRGCKFRATRANWAKNSRVSIELKPADLTDVILPPPPQLDRCLAILWSLPLPALRPTGSGGMAPSHQVDSEITAPSLALPIGAYAEHLAHRFLHPQDPAPLIRNTPPAPERSTK